MWGVVEVVEVEVCGGWVWRRLVCGGCGGGGVGGVGRVWWVWGGCGYVAISRTSALPRPAAYYQPGAAGADTTWATALGQGWIRDPRYLGS